jgi:hypothetical protein
MSTYTILDGCLCSVSQPDAPANKAEFHPATREREGRGIYPGGAMRRQDLGAPDAALLPTSCGERR